MVGFLAHGSLTKADSNITSEFPYVKYGQLTDGTYFCAISKYSFPLMASVSGYCYDVETGNYFSASTLTYKQYLTSSYYKSGDGYWLLYINGEWQIRIPMLLSPSNSFSNITTAMYVANNLIKSQSDSIPTGFPEVEIPDFDSLLSELDNKINESLNATTQTTNTALLIQKDIGTAYTDVTTGAITQADFQQLMDTYQSQLEDLANQSGNTLSDQLAINNALTYAQTVQINVTQTASPGVASTLSTALTAVTNIYNQYINKTITEKEATNQVNQYVTQVTNLIQSATTSADLEAINSALSAINGIKQSIGDSGDLDSDVAESMKASDQEEIDYLEDITAETIKTIAELSPKNQFTDAELGTATDIMGVIWENRFVKSLLVICGCFMVVCVVLGIRYRV